jgi:hypothetical protein
MAELHERVIKLEEAVGISGQTPKEQGEEAEGNIQ